MVVSAVYEYILSRNNVYRTNILYFLMATEFIQGPIQLTTYMVNMLQKQA